MMSGCIFLTKSVVSELKSMIKMPKQNKRNSQILVSNFSFTNFTLLCLLCFSFCIYSQSKENYIVHGEISDLQTTLPVDSVVLQIIADADTFTFITDLNGNYFGDFITQINPAPSFPQNFFIKQNYPNPFNPQTNIEYSGSGVLEIYSITGGNIFSTELRNYNRLINLNLATGLYFYRFTPKYGKVDTKKFVKLDGGETILNLLPINSQQNKLTKPTDLNTQFIIYKNDYVTLDTMIILIPGFNDNDFQMRPNILRFNLSGTITDQSNGSGIDSAQVLVIKDADTLFSVITDANGDYNSRDFFRTELYLSNVMFNVIKQNYSFLSDTITLNYGNNVHYGILDPQHIYNISGIVSNIDGTQLLQDTLKLIINGQIYKQQTNALGDFNIDIVGHGPSSNVEIQFSTSGWTTGTITVVDPRYVMTNPNSEVTYGVLGAAINATLSRLDSIPSLRVMAVHDSLMNDQYFVGHMATTEKMIGENWTWYNFTTDPSGDPVTQFRIDWHGYVIDYIINNVNQPNGVRYFNATKIKKPMHAPISLQEAAMYQDNSQITPGNIRSGNPVTRFVAFTRSGDPLTVAFLEGIGIFTWDYQNTNGDLMDHSGPWPVLNSKGKKVRAAWFNFPNGTYFFTPNPN